MELTKIIQTVRGAVISSVCLVLLSTGCATIMHGTTQDVGISSSPTGAVVSVDNKPQGTTPVIAALSRKDNHIVKIELPGYQPAESTITRGTSRWVLGNLLFGGLIGVVVDATSGGLYALTPEQISATLTASPAPKLDASAPPTAIPDRLREPIARR